MNYDREVFSAGTLLIAMMSLITGILFMIMLAPNMKDIMKAKVVGKIIFDVIERVPDIK